MTLSELIPAILQLSPTDKLELFRILKAELDTNEDISPLEPFKIYNLPTPYNSFGVGAVLMEAMMTDED
ncbi:hypothetical protein H6G76_13270 [Nostoc sp. FACHB-152]|uniref:hypothetical protein n=1 Tax=unclassified Nostoc TaxID=2593658 RepID=UPI0016887359|nr:MULTISPECIES: hypothetical protein [unclassified Nostoc]MBD2448119.1 hypothetical protein [Nostoc sp. FACHB-152]MBD2467133.1 hypothetical protein [Nostoc sp. FACHB-145]